MVYYFLPISPDIFAIANTSPNIKNNTIKPMTVLSLGDKVLTNVCVPFTVSSAVALIIHNELDSLKNGIVELVHSNSPVSVCVLINGTTAIIKRTARTTKPMIRLTFKFCAFLFIVLYLISVLKICVPRLLDLHKLGLEMLDD